MNRFMDVRVIGTRKLFSFSSQIAQVWLLCLWSILHGFISIWDYALNVAITLESYVISSGYLKKYRSIDVNKVRYLAIVIESEEARDTNKVVELLRWIADIGVKHVCLYDMEGVLKKSKAAIIEKSSANAWKEADLRKSFIDPNESTLEFVSFSDGKEGIAKAANRLFLNYLESGKQGGNQELPKFTEKHLDEALKDIGRRGPDPDLLLVYAPARCHLGFPAWRMRYTEIVHMGPLKSAKYGSLLKAIHRFTTVRQNFGS